MPLEEMVFGEEISRQEDEASGWIVAHSRKKQRQDFTPGDSPGPSAGHRAARPAHPKGPINKLIAASLTPPPVSMQPPPMSLPAPPPPALR
ncbi:hypothetical protein MRX96_035620 [Rhipicephalus microplus]